MSAADMKSAEVLVLQRLEAEWSATPIAWPGVPFNPPDGPWIRAAFLWGDGFQRTLLGENDVIGVLQLDVFTKSATGDGQALGYADQLRTLFNRLELGPIDFGAASGPRRGPDKAWNHVIVTIPYAVSETVTLEVA